MLCAEKMSSYKRRTSNPERRTSNCRSGTSSCKGRFLRGCRCLTDWTSKGICCSNDLVIKGVGDSCPFVLYKCLSCPWIRLHKWNIVSNVPEEERKRVSAMWVVSPTSALGVLQVIPRLTSNPKTGFRREGKETGEQKKKIRNIFSQ